MTAPPTNTHSNTAEPMPKLQIDQNLQPAGEEMKYNSLLHVEAKSYIVVISAAGGGEHRVCQVTRKMTHKCQWCSIILANVFTTSTFNKS